MVKCDSEAEIFLNNAQNAGDRARGAEHGANQEKYRAPIFPCAVPIETI